jgi:serine protease
VLMVDKKILGGIINTIESEYRVHGTSVLGEVFKTLEGIGIAPRALGRVISQWRTGCIYNTADAILDAVFYMVAHMGFGAVLLLEAQEYEPVSWDPDNRTYGWPVEIFDATYLAIELATRLGIVVVEAAGNGGFCAYNLDAYTNLSGKKIFNRQSRWFRDSGAVMVGAASSTCPHRRHEDSNYGNRIDCYAWGENIYTTTTNVTGTDNTDHTSIFGGTSGASSIVAGAALLVQSIAKASRGKPFSPSELREILTTNGTPSADPTNDKIGVMPNLRSIISRRNIPGVRRPRR